jgi:hypothetical protein
MATLVRGVQAQASFSESITADTKAPHEYIQEKMKSTVLTPRSPLLQAPSHKRQALVGARTTSEAVLCLPVARTAGRWD